MPTDQMCLDQHKEAWALLFTSDIVSEDSRNEAIDFSPTSTEKDTASF